MATENKAATTEPQVPRSHRRRVRGPDDPPPRGGPRLTKIRSAWVLERLIAGDQNAEIQQALEKRKWPVIGDTRLSEMRKLPEVQAAVQIARERAFSDGIASLHGRLRSLSRVAEALETELLGEPDAQGSIPRLVKPDPKMVTAYGVIMRQLQSEAALLNPTPVATPGMSAQAEEVRNAALSGGPALVPGYGVGQYVDKFKMIAIERGWLTAEKVDELERRVDEQVEGYIDSVPAGHPVPALPASSASDAVAASAAAAAAAAAQYGRKLEGQYAPADDAAGDTDPDPAARDRACGQPGDSASGPGEVGQRAGAGPV